MRDGVDTRLRPTDDHPGHTLFAVYREMLTQVCRFYYSLPDPRTLRMVEIRFFYDGLRPELQRNTAG